MALTKISTGVIAANTLATANIADNSVDATKIASNSILTRHIDDDQVTGDQLADNITIAGNLTITGNLVTNGSTVTNSSSNTTIEDAIIELGTGTSGSPATDAGIVNLKGSNKALAMTVDCNARMVNADPEEGCAMAVAEAARNIVCSGGVPSAITNCLNFGNPYNPEVYWQFVGAIKGMKKSCEKFNTPVTGGNVSFYNQMVTDEGETPVFPTPTIGMLGVVEDKAHITSLAFKGKSDLIYMLGTCDNDISSSEYLASYHRIKESSTPKFDLDKEAELQNTLTRLIRAGVVESAHDVADGGTFITLLESAMVNNLGFDITTSSEIREDAFLFGESPSRVIVSVREVKEDRFLDLLKKSDLPFSLIGHVSKGEIRVDDQSYGDVSEYKEIYKNSLAKKLA